MEWERVRKRERGRKMETAEGRALREPKRGLMVSETDMMRIGAVRRGTAVALRWGAPGVSGSARGPPSRPRAPLCGGMRGPEPRSPYAPITCCTHAPA